MNPLPGSNALHKAALAGSIRTMERLLNEGSFPVDAWNADGCTALMLACEQWDENSVEFLLNAGADANHADHEGRTALHEAVKEKLCDLIPALLHAGGNPGAPDHKGRTPLDLARSKKMRRLLGEK